MRQNKQNRSTLPNVLDQTNSHRPRPAIVAAALAISIGVVYVRALDTPFIFDDRNAILGNESIRSLWPLLGDSENPAPLNPESGMPLSARPLVNLTLAINFHFGGLDPTGFHLVNVVIHFLSALLVWAVTRRTLCLPYFDGRFDASAGWLACAVALLWALHPLQTEAVIYATQRTELMMALFYLATLYCSLRYWAADSVAGRVASLTLAILACLCGMASKEVMVSAPLIVLLFERTFIAGSLQRALRRSWPLYAGLASTWILLLVLNLGHPRGASAGFGIGLSPFEWWLTQCKVLLMYWKLVVWPWPLLIHYQWPYLHALTEAWTYAIPVFLLGIGTLVLLWRNKPIGFLGAWVFAILAPTSLVPILLELAAERRMYLPLAPLLGLLVVGGYLLVQAITVRWLRGRPALSGRRLSQAATTLPVILIALAFGAVSAKHLAAFDDETHLWRDVLQVQPNNFIAHSALGGILLYQHGQPAAAIVELQAALKLKPDHLNALTNLGAAFGATGRLTEAVDTLQAALALEPNDPAVLDNVGIALMRVGRLPDAVAHLEHLLQLQPGRADVHNTLGIALYRSGKNSDAIAHFKQALQLNPNEADAHGNLGLLLADGGQVEPAIAQLQEAVRLQPQRSEYQNNLGSTLRDAGRPLQAIEHFEAALRLRPDFWQAYVNLVQALADVNRSADAIATAKNAIAAALSAKQPDVAKQFEKWLRDYQAKLEPIPQGKSQSPPRDN